MGKDCEGFPRMVVADCGQWRGGLYREPENDGQGTWSGGVGKDF